MQGLPAPGSPVWLRQQRWRVDRARRERRVVRLDLSNAASRLAILTPYDRPRLLSPRSRPVRVRRQCGVARLAQLIGSNPGIGCVTPLIQSRLDLWAFQVEPALAARDGHRRILIADDVGLGKTIQAAIILADTLDRHPSARALVIAPAGLCRQWVGELRRRVGIHALQANDHHELNVHARADAHPWQFPGVFVASVDYLKQPHVFSALPPEAWDVVVIDEVHMASGQSERHDACDELGRRARTLVMLSATPHDGDPARFNRLMQIGRLAGHDDSLLVFRRTRRDAAVPTDRVVRWHVVRQTPAAVALFAELDRFGQSVLASVPATGRDDALLFLSVLRKRASSSALAVQRTLARRLAWLAASASTPRAEWQQSQLRFDDDDDDTPWTTVSLGLPAARERTHLGRLLRMASVVAREDPRLRCLQRMIARTTEPVVVFTEYRDTLEAIAAALRDHRSAASIHGGQSVQAQRHELERFLSGAVSVLVATDVASQGLNLQSRARWIVATDLPWNPVRLEQRIGRLDRLGQRRRVHATLLVGTTGADRSVLVPMLKRTLTARRQLGDDLLGGLEPPSRLAIAQSMVGVFHAPRLDLPPVRVAAPVPTRQYVRRARAHTRIAARRRLLLLRWQGADPTSGRPVLVRFAPRGLPPRAAAIAVLSVPVVDGTGSVVEHRLVALSTQQVPTRQTAVRTLAEHAATATARALRRRLDRIGRLIAPAVTRRLATERSLASYLHGIRRPATVQLALFSQRAARAFDDSHRRAIQGATIAQDRIRAEEARGQVTTGEASIVWIAVPR